MGLGRGNQEEAGRGEETYWYTAKQKHWHDWCRRLKGNGRQDAAPVNIKSGLQKVCLNLTSRNLLTFSLNPHLLSSQTRLCSRWILFLLAHEGRETWRLQSVWLFQRKKKVSRPTDPPSLPLKSELVWMSWEHKTSLTWFLKPFVNNKDSDLTKLLFFFLVFFLVFFFLVHALTYLWSARCHLMVTTWDESAEIHHSDPLLFCKSQSVIFLTATTPSCYMCGSGGPCM